MKKGKKNGKSENMNLNVTDLFGLLLSALEEEKPRNIGGDYGAYSIVQEMVTNGADYYLSVID